MKLEELKKLCDAATAGPWHQMAGCEWNVLHDSGYRIAMCGTGGNPALDGVPDAAFIAAARETMPKLIAFVEAFDAACVSPEGIEIKMTELGRLLKARLALESE